MTWEVEVSDEFIDWCESLNEQEGVSVDTAVDMLKSMAPLSGGLMWILSKRPNTET
jgi:hypothetical protein